MSENAILHKQAAAPGLRNLPALPAWLGAVGLVLLTLAAYGPVRHAGFIWDDDAYVTNNKTLRSPGGLGKIWFDPEATPQYYPLVHTSFWLEYHAWGNNPLGYHLINLLLHAGNVLLLWLVLRRLGVPGALLAAALFAVHPVQVESVAWISERKNVLSTFCYLASFLAWLRFWPAEEADPAPAGRWPLYVVTLLLFVAALLSKTVTCSLPAAFLLVRWWKHGRISRRDLLVSAPLFVLGLALGLNTVFLEQTHVGAQGEGFHWSALERALIAGRALWFYVGKLVWPVSLSFIYPRWEISTGSARQFAFPAAALLVILGLYLLRRRLGRGPLAAVLFFVVTLTPALGFFNVYPMRFSFVADHFQYLASVGLLVLGGSGFVWLLGLRQASRPWLGWGLLCLPIGLLGVRTWQQVQQYHDQVALWTETLAKNPGCWMAYHNRGMAYQGLGQLPQALADCTRALELEQARVDIAHEIELRSHMARVYTDRGTIYQQSGQLQQAIAESTRAIELKPNLAVAYNNRAMAYQQAGEVVQAIYDYTRALELNPVLAGAHANRGLAYLQSGQLEQAIADDTEAIALEPDLPGAYSNRGMAYHRSGQAQPAIDDFTRALELRPDAATYYSRGTVYQQRGQLQQALRDFTSAIELKPDHVLAYGSRGVVQHHLGQVYEAVRDYSHALALQPDFVGAVANRAMAYQELGDTQLAINDYSRALQLQPDLAAAYSERGVLYQKAGKSELALEDFTRALLLRPDWIHIYFARASLCYQLNRYAEAWSDVKRGQQLGGTPSPELVQALLQASAPPK